MKLPIPFLLYVTALGLLGWAGWTVYKVLPLLSQDSRTASSQQGMKEATDKVATGKGKGPVSVDWSYGGRAGAWWATLKDVNLIGKLPPPPPDPKDKVIDNQPPVKKDVVPLEDIIELVTLVCEGRTGGKGGLSYVIVRYKLSSNVQPPEEVLAATASLPAAGGPPAAMPRDVAPGRGNRPPAPPPSAPKTTMPSSLQGREFQQQLWVEENAALGHTARLWPPYEDIRLVRVGLDGDSAFFVRDVPPPKDGEPPVTPVEEPLIKTNLGLSQEVLRAVREVQGRPVEAAPVAVAAPTPAAGSATWQDLPDTALVNGVRHISRKDEDRFRDTDELFRNVSTDTYRRGSVQGVVLRSVAQDMASRFGVAQGDVLIAVNGRDVRSQAQAVDFGKQDYNRGVRTFVTKWLSNGQVVERVYQARDR